MRDEGKKDEKRKKGQVGKSSKEPETKAKNKGGRPAGSHDVFTDKKQAEILVALRVGLTYDEAASFCGVSRSGLSYIREHNDEFSRRCSAARQDLKASCLRTVAAASKEDAALALKALEYLRRVDGDKLSVEHSGKIEGMPMLTFNVAKDDDDD